MTPTPATSHSGTIRSRISAVAHATVQQMEGADTDWHYGPLVEFQTKVEPFIPITSQEYRAWVALICFVARDVMQNLSGDLNYDAVGPRVDILRANVHRAFRAAISALASDLDSGTSFETTHAACGRLVGEYLGGVTQLNELGGS